MKVNKFFYIIFLISLSCNSKNLKSEIFSKPESFCNNFCDNKSCDKTCWLENVRFATDNARFCKFIAKDKSGVQVVLDCQRVLSRDPVFFDCAEILKDVFVRAYTPVIENFLIKTPEALQSIEDFKNIGKNIGQTNSVSLQDWSRNYFFTRDQFWYGENDLVWFVTAKQENKIVGFMIFAIYDGLEFGTVKLDYLIVAPEAQNRGIGKILSSSIFKILSNVNVLRIILSTLKTNEEASLAYKYYGFWQYEKIEPKKWSDPLDPYRVHFEYNACNCQLLQLAANNLKLV